MPPLSEAEPSLGTPRCIGCGYVLEGLAAGPCPECGRLFDPADLDSVSFGHRVPFNTRSLLEPPGWLLISASVFAFFWVLAAFSTPAGPDFCFGGLGVLVGVFIGLVYGARVLLAIGASLRFGQPASCLTRSWRRWSAPPALLTLAIVMTTTHVPAHFRFALSRPALEKFAKAALASGTPAQTSGIVGLYSFTTIQVSNGLVCFHMSGGYLDWPVLIYVPQSSGSWKTLPPRMYGGTRYTDDWIIAWYRF